MTRVSDGRKCLSYDVGKRRNVFNCIAHLMSKVKTENHSYKTAVLVIKSLSIKMTTILLTEKRHRWASPHALVL
jgi:hypothetical protein